VLPECISLLQKHITEENSADLSYWCMTAWTKSLSDLKLDENPISYTFKTMACGIYALRVIEAAERTNTTINFKKLITTIVNECGSSECNGAVAGAVVGAYIGYTNLPHDFIDMLPYKNILEQLIIKFISGLSH
jgi:ADP-ribosylglycohydrolase